MKMIYFRHSTNMNFERYTKSGLKSHIAQNNTEQVNFWKLWIWLRNSNFAQQNIALFNLPTFCINFFWYSKINDDNFGMAD